MIIFEDHHPNVADFYEQINYLYQTGYNHKSYVHMN
jgi:hypothetical protein